MRYLVAVVPVFTRIPKSFYSVDALYYSVTLGSTDSSYRSNFDSQTAVYGDGPLIPHYGTDANGNTGWFGYTQDGQPWGPESFMVTRHIGKLAISI